MTPRRTAALVLPDLLIRLAEQRSMPAKDVRPKQHRPLAVVLVEGIDEGDAMVSKPGAFIDAVDREAYRLGVRPGQTIAEACAFVATLSIREVTRNAVRAALGEVAEVALRFGTTVSLEPSDTVWVDITGVGHLFGGEEALMTELVHVASELGHVVRAASAEGPILARAFARWLPPRRGKESVWVISRQDSAEMVARLPVTALPLDAERAAWLARLGVQSVGDLAQLPRAAAAARLGERGGQVLDLAEGCDATPLVPYEPPALPSEEMTWDEPVDGVQPLLFVIRGLVARLSARLEGRGEAAGALELDIEHDQSIARLRGVQPSLTLRFELASPMWRSSELVRVLGSRLERQKLRAPSIGLRLRVTAITRAVGLQLDLARAASGLGNNLGKGPETLPVLLGELAADIGAKRIGMLETPSAHLPEEAGRLVPIPRESVLGQMKRRTTPLATLPEPDGTPTRLLPCPVPFEAPLRIGSTVSIDRRMYTIRRVEFARRLDRIAWWTERPTSRDYLRVRLEGAGTELEALVYVNRETGSRFIQGVLD